MKILRFETYQGIRTRSGIEKFFSLENPQHKHRNIDLCFYKDIGVQMKIDDRVYIISFANVAFVEMVEENVIEQKEESLVKSKPKK